MNAARGELIGVSHLGETMQYLVRLGDDQSLIARRPTPEAPTLAVGDTVVCSWSADSVLLFPADDAASAGGYVAPPTGDLHTHTAPRPHRCAPDGTATSLTPQPEPGEPDDRVHPPHPHPRQRGCREDHRQCPVASAVPELRRRGECDRPARGMCAGWRRGDRPAGDRRCPRRRPVDLHVGRLRRTRRARGLHRRPRTEGHAELVQLERGDDLEARRRQGHERLRHRRADRNVHPADDRERPAREAQPRPHPEPQARRPGVPRPRHGTPTTQYSICKAWGTTGFVYDKTVDHARAEGLERLHRRRAERGERQDLGARRPGRAHGPLLLGERHRLEHDRPRRPRRGRGVPRERRSRRTSRRSTRTRAARRSRRRRTRSCRRGTAMRASA